MEDIHGGSKSPYTPKTQRYARTLTRFSVERFALCSTVLASSSARHIVTPVRKRFALCLLHRIYPRCEYNRGHPMAPMSFELTSVASPPGEHHAAHGYPPPHGHAPPPQSSGLSVAASVSRPLPSEPPRARAQQPPYVSGLTLTPVPPTRPRDPPKSM